MKLLLTILIWIALWSCSAPKYLPTRSFVLTVTFVEKSDSGYVTYAKRSYMLYRATLQKELKRGDTLTVNNCDCDLPSTFKRIR